MITLHRLGHADMDIHVNPDLIVTIEANPDTVITLANGSKILVAERPPEVAAAVRAYRVDVLAGALAHRRDGLEEAPPAAPVPLRVAPVDPRL